MVARSSNLVFRSCVSDILDVEFDMMLGDEDSKDFADNSLKTRSVATIGNGMSKFLV